MRFVSAVLLCAVLASTADARIFFRGRNNGNQQCRNGQCSNGVNVNVGRGVNVSTGNRGNASKAAAKPDVAAEQTAAILSRFDDLAVQQFVPQIAPTSQPAPTPPAPVPPPSAGSSDIDTLKQEINQLKQQVSAAQEQANKPFWVRVVDPRGKYTSEPQKVFLGQQLDLKLEPISESTAAKK